MQKELLKEIEKQKKRSIVVKYLLIKRLLNGVMVLQMINYLTIKKVTNGYRYIDSVIGDFFKNGLNILL